MKVESPKRGGTHVCGSLRRREGGPQILGPFGLARFEPPRAWIEVYVRRRVHPTEIAPEGTGHGLPLSKCEAYKRVYDQPYGSS